MFFSMFLPYKHLYRIFFLVAFTKIGTCCICYGAPCFGHPSRSVGKLILFISCLIFHSINVLYIIQSFRFLVDIQVVSCFLSLQQYCSTNSWNICLFGTFNYMVPQNRIANATARDNFNFKIMPRFSPKGYSNSYTYRKCLRVLIFANLIGKKIYFRGCYKF